MNEERRSVEEKTQPACILQYNRLEKLERDLTRSRGYIESDENPKPLPRLTLTDATHIIPSLFFYEEVLIKIALHCCS